MCLKGISTQVLKTRHSISVSDDRSKHSKEKGKKNTSVAHINESISMCMMDAVSILQAATCPVQNPINLLPFIMSHQ